MTRPGSARSRRGAGEGEQRIDGLGVSAGIAIGQAAVLAAARPDVPAYVSGVAEPERERSRLAAAVEKSLRQIEKLRQRSAELPAEIAGDAGLLLEAQALMLRGSRLIRGAEARIARDRVAAEAAIAVEADAIAESFSAIQDAYLAARAQEVREASARLLRNLTATPFQSLRNLPEGAVILSEEITPADMALIDPDRVVGFVTLLGGRESHTAIVARAMGMPAVMGATRLIGIARDGDTVIVDGGEGRVIIRPTAATLDRYERRRVALSRKARHLTRLARLPSVTRDHVEIRLEANIELPREIAVIRTVGAAGIGLLRSEFMFMNRPTLPSEDEQFENLAQIVKAMDGKPVTIRTLDVGGDKLASAIGDRFAPGQNPALGLRAIRLSLRNPDLLDAQLGAILRVGAIGKVRILLPMISTVDEVTAVRAAIARVARKLVRRGVAIADPLPPVGAMIEIPGAALAADALARVCDFFAIGTNDLTMYTLAIDRGDEQVAGLYNPLHPAVLRLIQFATEAALRARIPVSVCGEIAGDPRFTGLLIGFGIRELSMAAIKLPRVKHRVRELDLATATARARAVMEQSDPARIAAMLEQESGG